MILSYCSAQRGFSVSTIALGVFGMLLFLLLPHFTAGTQRQNDVVLTSK